MTDGRVEFWRFNDLAIRVECFLIVGTCQKMVARCCRGMDAHEEQRERFTVQTIDLRTSERTKGVA